LSRFLLALKVCLTRDDSGLTMIFDEIDRGVGGATADAVGRRLAALSEGGQVLVVTHSPQVAALGAHHWRVSKAVAEGMTLSRVEALEPDAHRRGGADAGGRHGDRGGAGGGARASGGGGDLKGNGASSGPPCRGAAQPRRPLPRESFVSCLRREVFGQDEGEGVRCVPCQPVREWTRPVGRGPRGPVRRIEWKGRLQDVAEERRGWVWDQIGKAAAAWRGGWEVLREKGPGQVTFWFIALLIGVAAGFAALFFRKGIEALQQTLYGVEDIRMIHSFAESLPWVLILLIPVAGGLVVGLILHWFTPDGRVRSVADVIEGAALDNGRVEIKAGLASALASMITLGSGGSSGREGPVVHLAAVISTWVSERMKADGITGRDLLGCAVAAAVSASFNAPIAGALFALEVVLRHFAVHAFAPIVIASARGR
jgi:hypothetical protein